jgi:hypothetical protein
MPRRPKPTQTPPPPGRPAFELDPSARLVACLRQAFPGFRPNDIWWFKVEQTLKEVSWMADRAGHATFVANYAHLRGDEVIEFLRVNSLVPAPPVDEYQRLADDLSVAARKILATLDEWTAYQAADKITKIVIEDRTRLTIAIIRRVMEREFPYVQPLLVSSQCGPAGGYWLTPEGKLVAAKIAKTILPSATTSPQRPRIRRARHA